MGIVERFGPSQISGWVEYRSQDDRQVSIKVNGVTVATTQACRPVRFNGEIRDFGFARRVHDLWNYIGRGDVVSLEYSGEKIPILRHGFHYHPSPDTISNFDALLKKIEQGYVFDKRGRLAAALNKRDNNGVFEAFEKIRDIVRLEFGYELFVFYGTLLGCVREGDFIAHDNDVDFAYISRHRERDSVVAEFKRLCTILIDSGYYGTLYRHGFGMKSPVSLDIYYTWFDDADMFCASFGHHGDAIACNADFSAFEEKALGPFKVRVPKAADRILSQLYGPTWRIPNPGFSHYSPNRKIPTSYLLTPAELSPLHWKQIYKRRMHDTASAPSRLAERVVTHLNEDKRLILELGCGAGADAIRFCQAGHDVMALDASIDAILLARRSAEAQGVAGYEFAKVDVEYPEDLVACLEQPKIAAAAAGAGVVVYIRQALELFSSEAEDRLFDLLRKYCGRYELFAEIKGHATQIQTPSPQYFARSISPEELTLRLSGYGLAVARLEGLEPMEMGEEPVYWLVGTAGHLSP